MIEFVDKNGKIVFTWEDKQKQPKKVAEIDDEENEDVRTENALPESESGTTSGRKREDSDKV
jgi:hypothetical protein